MYMFVLLINFRFLAFLQNLFQLPNGSILTMNHFLRFLKLLVSMQTMSLYRKFVKPIVQEFQKRWNFCMRWFNMPLLIKSTC